MAGRVLETYIGEKVNGYDVIGVCREKVKPRMIVQCPVCREDSELNGDAIYKADMDSLQKGVKCCECSFNPKRTKEVWNKLLIRKSSDSGQEYLGLTALWNGNSTYIRLRCKTCGHEHERCTIANYMKGRDCPVCAIEKRAVAKIKSDEVMIDSFVKNGTFAEGTLFSRDTGLSDRRKWKVVCGECNESYISDKSNLQAGKRSCSCSSGGGIDVKLPVHFYVLLITGKARGFVGFGITNFLERRMYLHRRELSQHGLSCEIVKCVKFEDGSKALSLESRMKRELDIKNQGIDGFRREAVDVLQLDTVLAYLEGKADST